MSIFDDIAEQEWKAPKKSIFDDIKPEEWEQAPSFGAGRLASQVGRSALQGVADVARGIRGVEAMTTEPRQPVQLNEGGYLSQLRRSADKATAGDPYRMKREQAVADIKPIEEYAPQNLPGTPKGFGGMVEQAASGMARFAPAMVTSAVNPVAGVGTTFTQIFGMERDKYLKQGTDEDRAGKAALFSALAQTPIEFAGNMLQINALKNMGMGIARPGLRRLATFGKALIQGAASEGMEEYLQKYPEAVADIYAANPKDGPKELAKKTLATISSADFQKQAGYEALVGAIGGLGLAGVGGVVSEGSRVFAKKPEDVSENQVLSKEQVIEGLMSGDIGSDELSILREAYPDLSETIDRAVQEYEGSRQVTPLPKDALPQQMPQPKSAEESAQVLQNAPEPPLTAMESADVFQESGLVDQALLGPDVAESARKRNQQLMDSIDLDILAEAEQQRPNFDQLQQSGVWAEPTPTELAQEPTAPVPPPAELAPSQAPPTQEAPVIKEFLTTEPTVKKNLTVEVPRTEDTDEPQYEKKYKVESELRGRTKESDRYFANIYDGNNKLVGDVTFSVDRKGNAKIGKIAAFKGKGEIGLSGIRAIHSQIKKQVPDIKSFYGDRVGAHLKNESPQAKGPTESISPFSPARDLEINESKPAKSETQQPVSVIDETQIPKFKNTEEAVKFGEQATPEQVTQLESLFKDSRKNSRALMDAKDFSDSLSDETYRGQLYREAIEASKGEHPSQKDKRTAGETLKPINDLGKSGRRKIAGAYGEVGEVDSRSAAERESQGERRKPTVESKKLRDTLKNEKGSSQLLTDVVNVFAKKQTETHEFKKWFGDSKVVDGGGRPIVFYHGTNKDFEVFDKKKIRSKYPYSFGFHFTNRTVEVNSYATSGKLSGSAVYPVYIKAEKPLIINTKHAAASMEADINRENIKAKLKDAEKSGNPYDSVIIKRERGDVYDGWNVIVFEPTQVKSALGNTGAFDPNNPSIIGTSELINDIAYHGAKLIRKGVSTFREFRASMKERFANIWDKIKDHMRDLWNILSNQRGEIKIEPSKKAQADALLAKLTKPQYQAQGKPSEKNIIEKHGGLYEKMEAYRQPVNEFIYWIADKNHPISEVQRKLNKVSDDIDLFLKETQRPKRTAARVQRAWDDQIKPFIESVAKSGLNLADVEQYAHAKHAREANQALVYANSKRYHQELIKILKGKQKTEATNEALDALSPKEWNDLLNREFEKYRSIEGVNALKKKWDSFAAKPSGMTNAEADAILEEWSSDKNIENLRLQLSEINNQRLEILHDAGVLADEEYKAIKSKYQHYVPLYREGYDDAIFGPSRGLQPSGRPIKVRGGSTRNVVNIVANSVSNLEKSINIAEKARSTKSLKELVEANPDPDFWSLGKVKKSPAYDSSGNLRMYPDLYSVGDNEFRFMADGKQYLLEVNRNNRNAMLMIKTLKGGPQMSGTILNAFARVNRFLARINTSWSPEFIVSNFVRDMQTANINIKDTGVKAKSMIRGAISAGKAIHNIERGKPKGGELENMYERFKAAGGKIGWSDVHQSVENLSKKIQAEIEKQAGKRPARKMVSDWLDMIENTNTAIENGVRLHAFKLAVDQGFTDERAAQIASDLTVDFTKRGVAGPVINSLYLFANAGIQGSYRIIRAAYKSKSVKKTMVGIFGAGFLVGLANSMAGNDDDGEDYFNKIEDFVRERNAIFMIPGTKGKYVKIPLPWGYNFVWNMGTEASRMLTKKDYKSMDGAARMASVFFNAFNPIASGTLLQTLAPTVADPFVQVAENKNWFGGPLMPEQNIFDKVPKPDSERYWKSARVPSVWVARQLNSLTGGDKIRKGGIDVSPETLDMVIDTVGGSALRFFTDFSSLPMKVIRQEETQWHEVPFWRRVAGQKSEFSDSTTYFNNIQNVLEAKERLEAYRGTDSYRHILSETQKERKLFGIAKSSESTLRKLRKARNSFEARGNKAASERIKKQMQRVYTRFNKAYNKE